MYGSNNNTIEGNTMVDGSYEMISRMELWASCNNSIFHNNFDGSRGVEVSVDENSEHNVWDDGYPSGGNYWSDYNGTDVNGDGIGDAPYIIDASNQDNYPLMNPWSPPDITITKVTTSKTVVGEGCITSINTTVVNQGGYTETFNVTVHANATIIGTFTNITLKKGQSVILTLPWNTTGFAKGNYTISAYVTQVSGEIHVEDNTLSDGWVVVTIRGDVNADFDVDLYDAVELLNHYKAKKGGPEYDPIYDIDGDGDIDLYDAVALLLNYGKKYP
jgi:hypothetical protein